jgi:tetratricopeptide (TPR) repeat protein
MGFFDFLSRRRKAALPSEELREQLFAAIRAKNWQSLGELCQRYHKAIMRGLANWKTAPQVLRGDPVAMEQYGHCLGTLAEFLARCCGEPNVWQILCGPDEANPVVQWPKKLEQADALIQARRFGEVISLLSDYLPQVQNLKDFQGNLVAVSLPRTHGHLGFCYFQTRQPERAVEPLAKALELCQQYGDAQGQLAYLRNLFEVHRYLGQPELAAAYAERLSEALKDQGTRQEAAWFQRQASMVRAGEPLVRLIARSNDARWELDEVVIPEKEGHVRFDFYRNRITLQPALYELDQADKLWASGQVDKAFSALLAASRADEFEPQSWYQMGVILLYMQAYPQAVVSYQKTEELAPGWFHCRRYLWLARQLAQGKLEHDTFLTLQALDGSREDRTPAGKVELAREALARTPEVSWLYLCLGGYLKEQKQLREAENGFRIGLDHAPEPDVKSCLLLELALVLERASPKRTRLLEEVRQLNGNLMATATAGIMLKDDARARA